MATQTPYVDQRKVVIPNTNSRVWYAYTLLVNGRVIGTLKNFNLNATMQLERVREIMQTTGARVLEIVPGHTDITATCEKVLIYQKSLVNCFNYSGDTTINSIEDVIDPFQIVETCKLPQNQGGGYISMVYDNCLINSYGRTLAAETTLVMENATIWIATMYAAIAPMGGEWIRPTYG